MGARISGHVHTWLVIRIALVVVVLAVLIDAYVPLALASYCRLIRPARLVRRAYGTYRPPPV
jgi:hypothetical protein